MAKDKKAIVIGIIVFVAAIVLILLIYFFPSRQGKYLTHRAITPTTKVHGVIPYNIRSDDIILIPEEDFQGLIVGGNITYDELVDGIGEPNGTIGSGIVRYYWRIGENKYAVMKPGGGFEIVTGEGK